MRRLKACVLPILMVVLVSVFPVLFMYFANAGEADFSEALAPLGLFALGGLCCFALCLPAMRSCAKAALAAGLFMLLFTNFALLEGALKHIFPGLHYWHTVPLFLVLWLHAAYLIRRFVPADTGKEVAAVFSVVLVGLLAFNLITAIPAIIEKVSNDRLLAQAEKEDKEQTASTQAQADLPNIYLLLFDEYGGFRQMEEYYGYDNAVLRDYLEKNHFTIFEDSHNESIMTTTIMTNLLNLDYVVDNTNSESEKEVFRKKCVLFPLMREHGYTVQTVETGDFLGLGSLHEDSTVKNVALTANGEDFALLCYQKTAVYPFAKINTSAVLDNVLRITEYLSDSENIPIETSFVFAYICFPHTPFIADENGNAIPSTQYFNWKDDRYYLGQYKYATTLMIRILENIITNDPNAIVYVMSDHGARASTDMDLFFEKFPLEIMNNPLSAVYYRGEEIVQFDGSSSLNTLRSILSQCLGENYNALAVPVDTYKYK